VPVFVTEKVDVVAVVPSPPLFVRELSITIRVPETAIAGSIVDPVPVATVPTLNDPQLEPLVAPVFLPIRELIPEDAVTNPEKFAVAPVRPPPLIIIPEDDVTNPEKFAVAPVRPPPLIIIPEDDVTNPEKFAVAPVRTPLISSVD
jgi:hypothetical protein